MNDIATRMAEKIQDCFLMVEIDGTSVIEREVDSDSRQKYSQAIFGKAKSGD